MDLFRGFDCRHGRYEIQKQEASGKLSGRAKTVDFAPTLADYEAHLEGTTGIGIIPLTQDNRVYFSALDIDVYGEGFSHAKMAERLKELPVLITRSKSGGCHVWLFTPWGSPASTVVDVWKKWASELGYGKSEIFPKQTSRASKEDVGNWINLPYFGDSRKCVMVDKKGNPVELTLEQFLDMAEAITKDPNFNQDWLNEKAPNVRAQRSIADSKEDFVDGPICLERIINGGGPVDGSRNNFFFNLAVYLYRKYGNAAVVKEKLQQVNYGSPEVYKQAKKAFESLGDAEISNVVKSATGKDYGYQCQQAPLCNYCEPKECKLRKFGIGSGPIDLPVDINGFCKILTTPPMYAFNADGVRVQLKNGADLLHQKSFRVHVMDATSKALPILQEAKWTELVNFWLENCDEVEGPPDSDPRSVILEELSLFIDRFKARDKKQILNGKVFWDEEKGVAIFRLNDFQKHLRNMRLSFEQRELTMFLKANGVKYAEKGTTVGTSSLRPWYAPLDRYAPNRDVDLDV